MNGNTAGSLLTAEEVAQRLGVGRSTVFTLLNRGEIASVQIGRLRRVTEGAVEEYIRHLSGSANGMQ